MAAGYHHTLALKTDGTLWTWGYNIYSQLGNASTVNRSAPAQVGTSTGWENVFPSGARAHQLAANELPSKRGSSSLSVGFLPSQNETI